VATSSLSDDNVRITRPHFIRRHRLSVVGLVAAAFVATVVPAGIGHAAPSSHLTIAQAQAKVAALNTQAEKITESYDAANSALGALQRKERVTARELTRDEATLSKVQKRVAAGAAAAYKTGGFDPTLSLVTSGTPQTFLDKTASLNEVARYEANQVSSASAAQRSLAAAQSVHNAQIAQQKKAVAAISGQRTQIQSLLNQAQGVLSQLKASQRAALARQQQTATQHAVAQRTSYTPPPSYSGPASGQASAAVQFAYAQLGKPYVYGAAGPSSFDCSGLTMQAWGAAGVSLPHNAAAQQSMTQSVSLSAMEPGDLVFFGSPAYHVGIYIGGGRMIAAPHTGAVVSIQSLAGYPPTSAGRP
jgi:cell wall-associated NlpC family hydrolase